MALWIRPVAAALLSLGACGVCAQVPDAEMARCATQADDVARLRCLDGLAAGAVARLKAGVTAPPLQAAPASNFGAPPPRPPAGPEVMDSEIEGAVEGWGPNTHFRLKNGQVWRVSDNSSGDLGLRNPKVKVRRNALGTYFMEFEGRNDAPRVRRVS